MITEKTNRKRKSVENVEITVDQQTGNNLLLLLFDFSLSSPFLSPLIWAIVEVQSKVSF